MANGLANSFVRILRNLFCVWAAEPQRSTRQIDEERQGGAEKEGRGEMWQCECENSKRGGQASLLPTRVRAGAALLQALARSGLESNFRLRALCVCVAALAGNVS